MYRIIASILLVSAAAVPLHADPAPQRDLVDLRGTAGYWRVGRDDAGVWWFVAPDGRREFLNCVTTVQPRLLGRNPLGPHYVSRDLPDRAPTGEALNHWAGVTLKRVESFGFKGIGAWSAPVFHQYDVPVTRDLNVSTWLTGDARWALDPAWEQAAERVIREQVAPLRDNKNLVGYYIDNELDWTGTDPDKTACVARRYFEITTRLIRKHDPNHLILGVRFRGNAPRPVVRASRDLTDAQSINYYPHDARLDREMFQTLHEQSGGQPVIVSEYSFHALDGRSGNRNTFGFPALVADQAARADGYRAMTTRLARLPYVIGADWFQWMDEPPSGRLRDGEDVNFGVVDIADEPYQLLVEAVRETAPRLNGMHQDSGTAGFADVWREMAE